MARSAMRRAHGLRMAMQRIADQQQFGPSVITIHCTDAPLQGVLEDFAHQAGADLGVYRPEIRGYLQSHKITLNLQRADFWTALQAIEDGSGLHLRPDNDGRMILDNMMGFWRGQMGDRSLRRIAGPCLIAPTSINWSHAIREQRHPTSAFNSRRSSSQSFTWSAVFNPTGCANALTTRGIR